MTIAIAAVLFVALVLLLRPVINAVLQAKRERYPEWEDTPAYIDRDGNITYTPYNEAARRAALRSDPSPHSMKDVDYLTDRDPGDEDDD